MSNIGNIFGNEGWIQSSIDKSRGKTRPGSRNRRRLSNDAAKRKHLLENEPMMKKYGSNEPALAKKPTAQPVMIRPAGLGLGRRGLMQRKAGG